MLAWLLALPMAFAADAQPGLFLPGAARMDALTGSVGAGTFCVTTGRCGPVIVGDLALTRRFVLNAQVPVLVEDIGLAVPATAGLRFDLLDLRILRLSAWSLFGAPRTQPSVVYRYDGLTFGASGIIGANWLYIDAAVPLAQVDSHLEGHAFPELVPDLEWGLNLAPGETNTFRIGLSATAPDVSWRFESGLFYGELGAAYLPAARYGETDSLLGRIQAGLAF